MKFSVVKRLSDYLSYHIRRPHRKGHGIHSPFLFDFVNEVLRKNVSKDQNIKKIESLRKKLCADHSVVEIEDFGAGSLRIKGSIREISHIARYSSTSPKYGRLLYKLVNHYKPEIIIELGCCLGLGTTYMATGNSDARVFTIEGSKELMQKAINNIEGIGPTNVAIKQGIFDDVLPAILKENGKFDLAFVDGNHRKDAVLSYFTSLLPYAHPGSIIIFDDIRWSKEMAQAWQEIKENPKVKLSLDLFQMGIVFFNEKLIKQHFELYY